MTAAAPKSWLVVQTPRLADDALAARLCAEALWRAHDVAMAQWRMGRHACAREAAAIIATLDASAAPPETRRRAAIAKRDVLAQLHAAFRRRPAP